MIFDEIRRITYQFDSNYKCDCSGKKINIYTEIRSIKAGKWILCELHLHTHTCVLNWSPFYRKKYISMFVVFFRFVFYVLMKIIKKIIIYLLFCIYVCIVVQFFYFLRQERILINVCRCLLRNLLSRNGYAIILSLFFYLFL